jgi:formylglycine-generating enzyme required for sulfatase activity
MQKRISPMKIFLDMKQSVLAYVYILLVLLLTACSSVPAVGQTPVLTVAAEDLPPAQAEQEPASLPPPSVVSTPTETKVSPPSTGTPVQPTQAASRVSEKDQMEQVFVEEGEFFMGTDDTDAKLTVEGGRAYPEIPIHTVYLPGYWMDKYEVTNQQYALCVDAGVCKRPNYVRSYTREHYFDNPEFSNYPVLYVDWFMAREYCAWAGRRLPTEAEWEKAARGNDKRRYPWGNEPVDGTRANFCDVNCPKVHANENYDDGFPETAPVGSFPAGASPYGIMDMAGNVWEWTSTMQRPYPYDAADGREEFDVSNERIWRGGPWSNGVWWIRASIRYRSVPSYWYGNLGFRCAASQ